MSDVTHIKDLRPDKRNARRHTPRNIGMIEKALGEVGAARSIVIDEENNIIAGNGTIEAAAAAGIEKVQVVDADGETIIAVRRSGLTPEQKQRLALYDNRTAELAEWDTTVLSDILDEQAGIIESLFRDDEIAKILEAAADDMLDAIGIDGDDKTKRTNNNFNIIDRKTESKTVVFQFGDVMCTIDRPLYDRMKTFIDTSSFKNISDAIAFLLTRGLDHATHCDH